MFVQRYVVHQIDPEEIAASIHSLTHFYPTPRLYRSQINLFLVSSARVQRQQKPPPEHSTFQLRMAATPVMDRERWKWCTVQTSSPLTTCDDSLIPGFYIDREKAPPSLQGPLRATPVLSIYLLAQSNSELCTSSSRQGKKTLNLVKSNVKFSVEGTRCMMGKDLVWASRRFNAVCYRRGWTNSHDGSCGNTVNIQLYSSDTYTFTEWGTGLFAVVTNTNLWCNCMWFKCNISLVGAPRKSFL